MSILIGFLNLVVLGSLAWWFSRRFASQRKILFWAALSVKLGAGVLLGIVYFYYYHVGDTISFFSDAVKLVDLLKNDPKLFLQSVLAGSSPIDLIYFDPRSFFFTVLLTFANLASGNNYWISSLWFSMFSFLCAWYLVQRIAIQMPGLHMASVIAFLFFPSVVFWSSGIIKESVAFGSLCFLTAAFISLLTGRRVLWYEYIAVLVSLWLLISLKYYWAAVFLPSILTTLLIHWLVSPRRIAGWGLAISWIVIFTFCCVAASFSHPNFHLEAFLDVIRENNAAFVAISDPGNLIRFPREVNTWSDVAINAPWALLSCLFRPMALEAHSLMGYVSSIENLTLLVLTLGRLTTIRASTGVTQIFWLSLIAYTSLLCIFLALSTPNFGTLSRYRIGMLPFFAMAILHVNPLLRRMGLRDF